MPKCTVKSIALLTVSASALSILTTGNAYAQSNETAIEEIVVTAQKREERINDVPLTISAASGEFLAKRGVSGPSDLVRITPGFQYTEGFTGTPVYTLRGVGFYDVNYTAGSTVAVYVDETPLLFSVQTQEAGLDIARVEVLKGPQGTLFGQNATGGAINYVAARPTPDYQAGMRAEVNEFGRLDVQGFLSGPLSDQLGMRLALKTSQGGAWQQSTTRNDDLGAADVFAGRLLLEWRPTDRLNFTLNVNGWTDESDVTAAQYLAYNPNVPGTPADAIYAGLVPVSGDNRKADWTPGNDYSRVSRQHQIALRSEFELRDSLMLTLISNYIKYKDKRLVDPDGADLDNALFELDASIRSWSQELRLTGTYDRAQFIAGLYYDSTKASESNANQFNNSSVNFLPFAFGGALPFTYSPYLSDQEYENTAVFGNLDYDLTERIKLHFGARYTDFKGSSEACTRDPGDGTLNVIVSSLSSLVRGGRGYAPVAFTAGECLTMDDRDPNNPASFYVPGLQKFDLNEHNLSWRAGISYQPSPEILFYLNLSKGFKSAQFPTLQANIRSQLNPATQESVLAYEAGAKLTLFDETMQLNGAAFYYDYNDKQFRGRVSDPIFGAIETMVNIPKSEVSGAEIQLQWRPIRSLSVTAGATYIETKVTKAPSFALFDPFIAPVDTRGSRFPYSPKLQFSVDAEYRWPVMRDAEAFIGGTVYYQSDSVSTFEDRTAGVHPAWEIDAYGRLDLRAGLGSRDGRWEAYVFGRNVTDAYYWTNSTRVLDTSVRIAGAPQVWGAALSLRWN